MQRTPLQKLNLESSPIEALIPYPPGAHSSLSEAGPRRLLEPAHELVQYHVVHALRNR